ncbi:MAG: aspartate 1-decarboxylase [Clostridia bacterium]|mgnify:CR=1 FL=1|nr:aspartate 1-decarboxylase [Clostridia bacterium]
MLRVVCRSKLHRATVTETNLEYEGSITIDRELLEKAGIAPYEMVQVVNINNGARFETYVMEGEAGTGVICLNGAAARLAAPGDRVIIIAYGMVTEEEMKGFQPHIIQLDEANRIKE